MSKVANIPNAIINDINTERRRQRHMGMDDFDVGNSEEDWIAYIVAYAGRASTKVVRNQRENQSFRDNMVKVAAIAAAAIEANDKGYL